MLEREISEALDRMAATEMPLSGVSIPAARQAGRTRRRVRRIARISAPVLAAAVVVAIALASVAGIGNRSRPGPGPVSPRPHATLTWPHAWLPGLAYGSAHSVNVYLTRISEAVIFVPASGPVVRFNAFPAGDCHIAAGRLDCKPDQFIGFPAGPPRLGHPVATLDGHPAYWSQHSGLIWQYKPGAWATLHIQGTTTPDQTVRLARTARFGVTAGPPVYYEIQLRSVPANWQVGYVRAQFLGGRLLARTANVTPGPTNGYYGTIKTTPEYDMLYSYRLHDVIRYACPIHPDPDGRETTHTTVINGVRVQLSWYLHGSTPQIACAPQAHGQHFAITAGEDETITAVTLFRHARLLGPDPAHWTTRLLG
jgi:hypothetical protein